MPPAHEVYASQLWPLGHGHPLWGPEPSPQYGEIRIGDIGYLKAGYFFFLFNCMHGESDVVNSYMGTPQKFEVFLPPGQIVPRFRQNHITQSQLHSRSIRALAVSGGVSASEPTFGVSGATGLSFECTEDTGAILLLQTPADWTHLDCDLYIKEYMKSHIENWVEFANVRLGMGLAEDDIIFVSGFTKTTAWAEAAFSDAHSRGGLHVTGGAFVPSISGEFHVTLSNSNMSSVSSRYGPPDRFPKATHPQPPRDQSIFLNYYKIKTRRFRAPKILRGASGVPDQYQEDDDDFPPGDSKGSETRDDLQPDTESPESSKTYDPVGEFLDHILEISNVPFACASDREVFSLVNKETRTTRPSTTIHQHLPSNEYISPASVDPALPVVIEEFAEIVPEGTSSAATPFASVPPSLPYHTIQSGSKENAPFHRGVIRRYVERSDIYSGLRDAEAGGIKELEKMQERLLVEWRSTGVALFAFTSAYVTMLRVDVFPTIAVYLSGASSNRSTFIAFDSFLHSTMVAGALAAGMGLLVDIYLLMVYSGRDTVTFQRLTKDASGSWFFFSLLCRFPGFCALVAELALKGSLLAFACTLWIGPVVSSDLFISLVFVVFQESGEQDLKFAVTGLRNAERQRRRRAGDAV